MYTPIDMTKTKTNINKMTGRISCAGRSIPLAGIFIVCVVLITILTILTLTSELSRGPYKINNMKEMDTPVSNFFSDKHNLKHNLPYFAKEIQRLCDPYSNHLGQILNGKWMPLPPSLVSPMANSRTSSKSYPYLTPELERLIKAEKLCPPHLNYNLTELNFLQPSIPHSTNYTPPVQPPGLPPFSPPPTPASALSAYEFFKSTQNQKFTLLIGDSQDRGAMETMCKLLDGQAGGHEDQMIKTNYVLMHASGYWNDIPKIYDQNSHGTTRICIVRAANKPFSDNSTTNSLNHQQHSKRQEEAIKDNEENVQEGELLHIFISLFTVGITQPSDLPKIPFTAHMEQWEPYITSQRINTLLPKILRNVARDFFPELCVQDGWKCPESNPWRLSTFFNDKRTPDDMSPPLKGLPIPQPSPPSTIYTQMENLPHAPESWVPLPSLIVASSTLWDVLVLRLRYESLYEGKDENAKAETMFEESGFIEYWWNQMDSEIVQPLNQLYSNVRKHKSIHRTEKATSDDALTKDFDLPIPLLLRTTPLTRTPKFPLQPLSQMNYLISIFSKSSLIPQNLIRGTLDWEKAVRGMSASKSVGEDGYHQKEESVRIFLGMMLREMEMMEWERGALERLMSESRI
jgi:hypothetical protein